jgi:GTP-binding protein Era
MNSSPTKRCGFIAIIGAPNAGKSTLLNRFVGSKIAIVTHKVQTTRTRITGIAIEGDTQLVFVDTPGIFKPRRKLDRAMVSAAWRGAQDADLILLMVDALDGITGEVNAIVEGLKKAGRQAILALNKVDTVKRDTLLAMAQELDKTGVFSETFMISALDGNGTDDLRAALIKVLPEGPWLYPEDQITDVPLKMLAAEITREQIYLRLHQELPYQIAVEAESWQERKDGSIRIEQVIFVERKTQKGIVIGKGGQSLKKIGEMARTEMEAVFGCKIHLFLFVKVAERWSEKRFHYSEIGLDYVE